MAKVLYKVGTKATYLSLTNRQSNALYFCTDTRELFKGNDLYSDGLRIVATYDVLPAFEKAADGILYFCKDTGCGYVLNEARDGWLSVVHGVDNETIEVNTDGLIAVKTIPILKVENLEERLSAVEAREIPIAGAETAGLVKSSDEVLVAVDGKMVIGTVAQEKVSGLTDRLASIEAKLVGGVHYMGSVPTYDDLPADAKQGDLYEVTADNSEWCFNGEKWFEYGKIIEVDLSHLATHDEVKAVAQRVKFEISSKPEGALVRYSDTEIRVMCPENTVWTKQSVGATGNSNMYYMGFKAYAPDGAVSFKEGDHGVVEDTMFTFDDAFAGTDEYGRNYSIVWLALASYDEATDTWSYFGKNSTAEKYIGWDYVVEWYNAKGVKIDEDSVRINLSNEDCHHSNTPYYVNVLDEKITTLEEAVTWGDM